MLFKPGTKLYSYEVVREEGQQTMYVNFLGAPFVPDLVDKEIMGKVVDPS